MQNSAILFYFLVIANLISISVSFGIRDVNRYEHNLDDLLRNLYGDYFEPESEIFYEPRFANHGGTDSAKVQYTNEWLVYVPGGEKQAHQLANDTGYIILGAARGFPKVFRMQNPQHAEHKRSARELTQQLIADDRVTWADQLCLKDRSKREAVDWNRILKDFRLGSLLHLAPSAPNSNEARFNDELWEKEWYIQDTRTRKSLPRLDLNVVPVFEMGITGKGVNVVILDDGIEHTHADLIGNYNPKTSYDLNDDDSDPMPKYDVSPANSHGTRCAGEVSMKANNSKCGVGIAYDSSIGGIRMLDGPVSDRIEGESLAYALNLVDVFSASWGPNDNGEVVEGPGRLAQTAFLKGVTQGRKGKGVVYVWASGNGGAKGDACSCDGYASSIYTLSIGSASESGSFPWYGEMCPSTMAVTYSSGAYTDQKIATTDIHNSCTTSHTGTSASAPLAAGIVALTFQANPILTWRDVQHLVVWTSQPSPLKDNPGWSVNAAGFEFNSRFGFGLMDAHGMVTSAMNWTNVAPQRICRVKSLPVLDSVIDPSKSKIVSFTTDACHGTVNEIKYLEHIEVITTVRYSRRGALQIQLTSPQGTTVDLLVPRKNDISSTGFNAWPFMSVSTWGENPNGNWTFSLFDSTHDKTNEGYMDEATLVLYGTKEMPERMKAGRRIYPEQYKKKSVVPKPDPTEIRTNQLEKILQDFDLNIQNWV